MLASPLAIGEPKPDNDNSTEVMPEMTVSEKITPTAKDRYKLPTTTESVTKEKMAETVNAMNAEDVIKYLPSITVRKRYIGDTNAPVAMRTSGTSSSARSLIYADGILLSSLLGNNNVNTGSPRWNMVSPSEIERIDVMYGPFSAAYAGNSIGGVIDITTRMPEKFEAGGSIQATWMDFAFYGKQKTYDAQQYSFNLGDRRGGFSWRFDVSHLDSHSMPVTYATLNQPSTTSAAGTPVTGAIPDGNPTNVPIQVLGETNLNHTVQDNFKWKLAYDITPTIRAAYTLGLWQNDNNVGFNSFLRDAAGNPINSGRVNIDGRSYNLSPTNAPVFAENNTDQMHWSHGMNLKSNTGGLFDWELIGSVINYGEDTVRVPTVTPALAAVNGAGRITSLTDTGWHTVDAKGIWRPFALCQHEVSFGFHHDLYNLENPVYNTSNWRYGSGESIFSNSRGKTQTEGYWLQDAWDFHEDWNLTLGGRLENWQAYDGLNSATVGGVLATVNQSERDELEFSPKAKLTWKPLDRIQVGAAIGQAYRFPTVTELFQTSSIPATNTLVNGNPGLKPEEALSSELSGEYFLDQGRLRLSLFHERVYDAIFSQRDIALTALNNNTTVNTIQNVDEVNTYGIEFSGEATDVGIAGLDLSGSATWTDSRITRNDANPNSVGKRQPRVPEWRATATVTYRPIDKLSTSVSGRYSSEQFGQLDNSDTNHFTYQGTGSFFVVDLRAKYQFTKQISASAGIDNVNDYQYFIFHPFPTRTYFAELKYNY
ncbi:MAG: TonB-dependent receptor [Methylobacter sp.]